MQMSNNNTIKNSSNFDDIKINKENNLKKEIFYTDIYQKNKKINKNDIKESQNIVTDCNSINYLTKKILCENKDDDNEKKIEKKFNNYEDKSKIKTNFNYNNYKNKEEFIKEIIKNESNKKENNDIKRKKNLNKENIDKKMRSLKDKDKFQNNILQYQEIITKITIKIMIRKMKIIKTKKIQRNSISIILIKKIIKILSIIK